MIDLNVLDIDLDFFFDQRVDFRPDDPTNRPDDEGLVPWSENEVIDFVEHTLNLRSQRPGLVVQSHGEVFYEWRRLIENGELTTPFKVVHVDAHSDLMGSRSSAYLPSDFLSLNADERSYAQKGDDGINFGSYLAFALGCRWVSELDFVINPNWHGDILPSLLTEHSYDYVKKESRSGILPYGKYDLEIELMQTPERWEPTSGWDIVDKRRPIGEPCIPFKIIPIEAVGSKYSSLDWDFVFLSHSPGYVPSYGDHLLELVQTYLRDRAV